MLRGGDRSSVSTSSSSFPSELQGLSLLLELVLSLPFFGVPDWMVRVHPGPNVFAGIRSVPIGILPPAEKMGMIRSERESLVSNVT